MDVLTFPRLRAELLAQGPVRQLKAQLQAGGEEGRLAAQRLGRSTDQRPKGPLVWLHAPSGLDAGAFNAFVEQLTEADQNASVLLTSTVDPGLYSGDGVLVQQPPVETFGIVERFLDHWQPDVGVWFGGVTEPLLADAAARRGMPLILQDAVAPDVPTTRSRVLQRRLLGLFERIFTIDATEADRIRSIGSIPSRVETTGRLVPVTDPLPCVDSERALLAAALDTRPVWMVVSVPESELEFVLDAHRIAKRTTHRLLLIIVPREEDAGQVLCDDLVARGWSVARRDAYEDPEEATDIFVADCADELGLYYRLSPITYLGGTFSGDTFPNPMHAATLGSAIITGPEFGDKGRTVKRLCDGVACRRIAGSGDLAGAVSDLLSPEQAAILALNAWNIATDGVLVRDRLVSMVKSVLNDRWTA